MFRACPKFDTLSGVFLGKMSFVTHIDVLQSTPLVVISEHTYQSTETIILHLHKLLSKQNISSGPQVVFGPFKTIIIFTQKFSNNCTYLLLNILICHKVLDEANKVVNDSYLGG